MPVETDDNFPLKLLQIRVIKVYQQISTDLSTPQNAEFQRKHIVINTLLTTHKVNKFPRHSP